MDLLRQLKTECDVRTVVGTPWTPFTEACSEDRTLGEAPGGMGTAPGTRERGTGETATLDHETVPRHEATPCQDTLPPEHPAVVPSHHTGPAAAPLLPAQSPIKGGAQQQNLADRTVCSVACLSPTSAAIWKGIELTEFTQKGIVTTSDSEATEVCICLLSGKLQLDVSRQPSGFHRSCPGSYCSTQTLSELC